MLPPKGLESTRFFRDRRPRPRLAALAALAAVVAASVLVSAVPAAAQAPRPDTDLVRYRRTAKAEITPQLRVAIDRGLDYLIRNQRETGSFANSEGFRVAVDALGGLAFLAGGFTDREGPYTEEVRRAIASLLSYQNDRGYFDDGQSRMYGHGFATLFFAELYGMTGDLNQTVRTALTNAIRLIERSQGADGGWDYQPESSRGSDTSITVCQTMALRAARNLGIYVDKGVVDRARDYIRNAQNPDGGFCYRIIGKQRVGWGSQFPRSAAGVCILYSLAKNGEEYSSTEMRNGWDYLLKNYTSFSQFPFYGDYYCAQAMFQAGGKYWAEYYPYMRDRLLKNQEKNGSWSSFGVEVKPQATAMALIALQVPFRLLPILER